jgi:ABC-2 type transport system permease protein
MRALRRLFILSWSQTLQYRADLFIWLVAITATPLLSLAIWYATAKSGISPLGPEAILTYYLLIMVVRVATASWRGFQIIQEILNGEIVRYLIRPPAMLWEFVTSNLTAKILQIIPLLGMFTLIMLIWPQAVDLSSLTYASAALFAISVVLAYIISAAFDFSIGLAAFWLEEAQELMSYRFLLTQVASGVLIPFALMPDWLHTSLSLLPFRYTLSAPVEIFMGQVTGIAAWQLIGIQAVWAIGFIIILRTMYVRGLKRYAVPGQ